MGANRWREEREWPPARARVRNFYLASRGRANTLAGDGALQRAAAAARRGRPLHLRSARSRCPRAAARSAAIRAVFPWGPMDQRPVEQRRDVLVYTTRPLRARPGSDRAGEGGALRRHQPHGHGFHRQAGGRVPGRLRAQSDRRHSAAALPQFARAARAGASRARSTRSRSTPASPATCFSRATASGWRFRAAISRASTATPTPARPSQAKLAY